MINEDFDRVTSEIKQTDHKSKKSEKDGDLKKRKDLLSSG